MELREHLYEDAACLVEEYLFLREEWPVGNPSQAMKQSLFCDDFDTFVYIYFRFFRQMPLPYTGSFAFEKDLFRCVQSVPALKLLFSLFGPPSRTTIICTVMHYCVRAWPDLLLFVCERCVVPNKVFDLIIAELSTTVPHCAEVNDGLLPIERVDMRRHLYVQIWNMLCTPLYRRYDKRLDTTCAVLRERRRRCLEIVRVYRNVLDTDV